MTDLNSILEFILLLFLIVCAIGVSFTKNLFMSVTIFMCYSSVLAVIWLLLRSPDLAITQATVGAGVDSLLFFLTLKKVHQLKGTREG